MNIYTNINIKNQLKWYWLKINGDWENNEIIFSLLSFKITKIKYDIYVYMLSLKIRIMFIKNILLNNI